MLTGERRPAGMGDRRRAYKLGSRWPGSCCEAGGLAEKCVVLSTSLEFVSGNSSWAADPAGPSPADVSQTVWEKSTIDRHKEINIDTV